MKNKGGRPKIEIDKDLFESLCAIHCTQSEIAGVLKCSEDTIQRWCKRTYENDNGEPMGYTEVYDLLTASGKASLRRQQWKLAKEGDKTMLIWLGKQWLNQKEIQDIQVTNTTAQNEFAELMDSIRGGDHEDRE